MTSNSQSFLPLLIKLSLLASLGFFALNKRSHTHETIITRNIKAERLISKEIIAEPRLLFKWLGLRGQYMQEKIEKVWPKNQTDQAFYKVTFRISDEFYRFRVFYKYDQEVRIQSQGVSYYNVRPFLKF